MLRIGLVSISCALAAAAHAQTGHPDVALVVTQLPVGTEVKPAVSSREGDAHFRVNGGPGARIVLVQPDRPVRILSKGFHSACDPHVSFDAQRIVFAGKRTVDDPWNIYELTLDTGNARQITRDMGNCRQPCYQSALYTIVSPEPWYQLTFVSDAAQTIREDHSAPATHLYSCMLDGTRVSRLTYNLSSDFDPVLMDDGRLLFASSQQARMDRDRVALFSINLDGTDLALFAETSDAHIQHMPCVSHSGLVVFVTNDRDYWDGAGRLAAVTVRRPLHSFRSLSGETDGLFHSPSPLDERFVLVSRRTTRHESTHAVGRFDVDNCHWESVFDDPRYHDIQAVAIQPRAEPDGRSSVVSAEDPIARLYCLSVYTSDLAERNGLTAGTIRGLRVVEGIPYKERRSDTAPSIADSGDNVTKLPLALRRILGELALPEDGSFKIEVPANTPLELQTLDADGMALRRCGWIWGRNHEPRGCIGCHEDGELTPENVFTSANREPNTKLALPPQDRQVIDFRRDIMPLVKQKCVVCHAAAGAMPRLDEPRSPSDVESHAAYPRSVYETLLSGQPTGKSERGFTFRYVDPGRARTSPLIWHLFGRNTARPWDGDTAQRAAKPIPAHDGEPLTDLERRIFIQWIDMGAAWDSIPREEHAAEDRQP